MTVNQTIELKLEVERVHLLYKQNTQGVLALLLFASTYAYLCGNLMSPVVFTIWLICVYASALVRIIASSLWTQKRSQIISITQVNRWHLLIQSMIFISGVIWGLAAWLGSRSPSPEQQIITAITVVFMSAGALVCWSPSIQTMFTFVIPAMTPWALSYLLKSDNSSEIIGIISILFVLLGSRAGIVLNQYIDRSLKLNIENSELTRDLQEKIIVKDLAEEALRLALSSSNAIEWRWDVESDTFLFKGDLSRSLGLQTNHLIGKLDELAQIFCSEDQQKFKALFLSLALKGGEIDADLRIHWPNGMLHDLAFRGKAQTLTDGKITHLTGIAWDITSQKTQIKLQQEKDIHEAANKAKSFFLANASHEIRTPLAAINGYVDSLLQNSHTKEELQKDLKIISRHGKFLTSLVNDFLDLSKIESGRFYIQKSVMSPKKEIEEVIQLFQSEIESKNITLETHFENEIPNEIESDPNRFKQILVNLLSNAAKFTNRGKISIIVKYNFIGSNEGQLNIKVSDTGIGIDEKTKTLLFEPFLRGQDVEVQRVKGSGLGLALSRNLAQLLGGDLKLNSSILGMGSEFEFYVQTGKMKTFNFNSPIESLQSIKILVVDDAIDLRVLMQRLLERKGALVYTAENGEEAIRMALEIDPDVILMDIKMPVMDGLEATQLLRKKGFKKAIIAITAHASADDKNKSLEAGCDFYLSKPVDFKFLYETILNSQQRSRKKTIKELNV